MGKKTYASQTSRMAFSKTRVFTWLAYFSVIVVSVLASCYELLFDFENFDATKFATKLSISLCISIMGLLMAIKDGRETNEGKRFGKYAEAKASFAEKVNGIVNKEWFKQWADGVLYPRERKTAIASILNEVGIDDLCYAQVSDDDLRGLEIEPKMCEVGKDDEGKPIVKPLDKITKEQARAIRYVRERFKFKQLDYTYFTSTTEGSGYSYYATLKDRQRRRKAFALAYRVFMIVATTSIFALAVINPHGEGIEQVAFDTVGRITTLITSILMGYGLANDEMEENIDSMAFKGEKIDEYEIECASGSFVPKSKDEVVLRKIEEIERSRKSKEAEKRETEETEAKESEDGKDDRDYVEVEMTEDEFKEFSKSN